MSTASEKATGWLHAADPRRLLTSALLYRIVQHTLAPRSSRLAFVHEYVRPGPEDRILDVGCGPADDLTYMPDTVGYVGFDLSERYVEAARSRWGARGTFFQAEVSPSLLEGDEFDIIIANGVLHHLNDGEALGLLNLAHSVLLPGGRLVTKDPVFVDDQHPVARFLLKRDRGSYVRDTSGYLRLAQQVFAETTLVVRSDLLRCPYDHAIMEMSRPGESTPA